MLSDAFSLPALTTVTRTLSESVTNFRWVHVLAGEDDINGLGLGVIAVPLAEIPVSNATPQGLLYGVDQARHRGHWQSLPGQPHRWQQQLLWGVPLVSTSRDNLGGTLGRSMALSSGWSFFRALPATVHNRPAHGCRSIRSAFYGGRDECGLVTRSA